MTTSTNPMSTPAAPETAPRLSTGEFLQNPYPAWAYLRKHAPVHFSEEWNAVLITRYSDVVAGFRDPRLSSNRISAYAAKLPQAVQERVAPLIRHLSGWVLFSDAPAHTRLRGLLNRAFAPRLVEALRPRLATIVDELFADIDKRGEASIDVIRELAVPLPVLAIGEILGLPASDRHLLKDWSDALVTFLGARQPTPELVSRTLGAIAHLEQYFRELIALRRRQPSPQEDLLTALLSAEENGALLSEQELLSTCSAVLFGGHETTTNLIGNAAWVLSQHPEAQALLRREPGAIPAAVEEVLRLESPLTRMGRVVGEDFELHGQPLRKGQLVWLVMASANRDPEQFPEPDSFVPQRTDNRHLAFGFGGHFCIGAALGRLEAQLSMRGLLRALPAIKLVDEPYEWMDNLTVHGFKRLRLARG
jgi:cytochrome P450